MQHTFVVPAARIKPALALVVDQLGLKLEPSTTAVQVVAIDHIERPSGAPR